MLLGFWALPGELHSSRVLRMEVGGEPEEDIQEHEPGRVREKQNRLQPGREEQPFPETLCPDPAPHCQAWKERM